MTRWGLHSVFVNDGVRVRRKKFWSKFYKNWTDITPKPDWLPNSGINAGTRVQDSHPRRQPLEAATHWRMSKRITKHHRRSWWSMEKAISCMRESERTSLLTSAELKRLFFRAITLHYRLFSDYRLPQKTHYASRYLRHCRRTIFKSTMMLFAKKLQRSPCLWKLKIAKFGALFETRDRI